ncbi:unnamed protein product, partial [Choristocarpus tenellus]
MSSGCFSTFSNSRGEGRIRVAVRVRPFSAAEFAEEEKRVLFFPKDGKDGVLQVQLPEGGGRGWSARSKLFKFDHALPDDTDQAEVFELVRPLVEGGLEGYNCAILAYGQTGTGKTYTISGGEEACGVAIKSQRSLRSSKRNPKNGARDWRRDSVGRVGNYNTSDQDMDGVRGGLVSRVAELLLSMVAERERRRISRCRLSVTYLEVYNERVLDLLGQPPPGVLGKADNNQHNNEKMHQNSHQHNPNHAQGLDDRPAGNRCKGIPGSSSSSRSSSSEGGKRILDTSHGYYHNPMGEYHREGSRSGYHFWGTGTAKDRSFSGGRGGGSVGSRSEGSTNFTGQNACSTNCQGVCSCRRRCGVGSWWSSGENADSGQRLR